MSVLTAMAAVRAASLTKIYGTGETAVRAPDPVTVAAIRPARRAARLPAAGRHRRGVTPAGRAGCRGAAAGCPLGSAAPGSGPGQVLVTGRQVMGGGADWL